MKYNLTNFCEIDKFAINNYVSIHNEDINKNLGDISLVQTEDMENFELLVGGSPCFPSKSLINTKNGYKEIQDIKINDIIKTHKGSYQKVKKRMVSTKKSFQKIQCDLCLPIIATDNHPFYVRRKNKNQFIKASYINTNDYLIIPKIHEIYEIYEDFKLSLSFYKTLGYLLSHIDFCRKELILKDSDMIKEFILNENEIEFFKKFLDEIYKERIPDWIKYNSRDVIMSFLEGFYNVKISKTGIYKKSLSSLKINYQIGELILKVYSVPYMVKESKNNEFEIYIFFNYDKNKYFTDKEYFYIKPTNNIAFEKEQLVYNLEVETEHTYCVNNIAVHNCTDFSIAGRKKGSLWTCKDCDYKYNPLEAHYKERDLCPKCHSKNIEKTASSLIVEYLRILREKQPKIAIYENVKNLVNKEFKYCFDLFLKELDEIGYFYKWEIMNSKYYGIPQNRERIILVIIRKDIANKDLFNFPSKHENKLRVKDIVQEKVAKNYYISEDKSDELIKKLINECKLIDNRYKLLSIDEIIEKKVESNLDIMNLGLLNFLGQEQIRRVYDEKGISPTVTTCQGGNRQIKILQEDDLPICVASRGRNPDNPNSRIIGDKTEQRLEPNYKNISNTLTSVSKDNYILENDFDFPCIMKYERNEYGKLIRKEYELGNQKEKLKNMREIVPRNDGQSNTLTTVQKDNYLLENDLNFKSNIFNYWLFEQYKIFFKKHEYIPIIFNPYDCTELNDINLISNNLQKIIILNEDIKNEIEFILKNEKFFYKIRKLTPRECFRLMGFNDNSYNKIRYYENDELKNYNNKLKIEKDLNKNLRYIKTSDTQLYKQAGNSIVVEVLYYLFLSLREQYPNIIKENVKLCSLFSGIGAFEQALTAIDNSEILVSNQFLSENF